MKVAQSCLTCCDPMDCSLPDFSVHGFLQARILEWVAVPNPGIEPRSPTLQADSLLSKPFILIGISILAPSMAPHSSTLAWKIPWTEEPGVLQSLGSLRVGHDWMTSLSLFTFMHWRRQWQPTPVFLPGESQGWRSLVGCPLWGRTESDTTEAT